MNSIEAVRIRLKALIKEKKITYNALGNKCGINPSSIKSIFYKRAKSTTIHTITLLCDGLDITVKEFFDCDLFNDLDDLD